MFVWITPLIQVAIRSFTISGRDGQLGSYICETHLLTPPFFSRHFGTCLMTTFIFCLLPETSKGRWKFHLVFIFILQPGTFFRIQLSVAEGRVQ